MQQLWSGQQMQGDTYHRHLEIYEDLSFPLLLVDGATMSLGP